MPAVRAAGRNGVQSRSRRGASPSPARTAAPVRRPRRSWPSPSLPIVAGALTLAAAAAVAALAVTGAGARLSARAASAADDAAAGMGLEVADVRLSGASATAAPDILRAAAIQKGAALPSLDLEAVRQRVERVGWVRGARVMRLYPSSVVILVDQRRLVAIWEHGGKAEVIDDGGVAAPEADPAGFASLPLVVGEGANTAAAEILPRLASRPRLGARVVALVRVDERRWDLALKGGSVVELPASDEEGALIRLDELDQQSRVLDLGFARIDLRDPDMVLVRPKSAEPAAAVHATAPGPVA